MSPDDGQSVLGNLPSTRPTRMARRRDGAATPPEAPKPKRTPAARPKPKAATRPRAVRSGSPSLARPRTTGVERPKRAEPPKGTELVTTAVQATAELAQIGATLGGRVLKRAVKRLPKP